MKHAYHTNGVINETVHAGCSGLALPQCHLSHIAIIIQCGHLKIKTYISLHHMSFWNSLLVFIANFLAIGNLIKMTLLVLHT